MNQFGVAVDVVQFHDLILVELNGSWRDRKSSCDLLCGMALGQKLQDFPLARGQTALGLFRCAGSLSRSAQHVAGEGRGDETMPLERGIYGQNQFVRSGVLQNETLAPASNPRRA